MVGMGEAGLAQLCVAHQYKDSMKDHSQIEQVLRNPLNPCSCLGWEQNTSDFFFFFKS